MATTTTSPDRAADWAPLEATLPREQLGVWMWMGRELHGDRVIEQYKHQVTKQYLNLDQDGVAWRIAYVDGKRETPRPLTFAEVLARVQP